MAIAKVGTEIYNLLRLGFLKAESAGSDRAIKAATTKYNKVLAANPEFARVESIRLNGDTQRNVQDLGERTIITPDSLLGNVLVPVAGDRTLTGNTLTKSQGFGLLDNVDIKGGPRFPMEHQNKGLGWASMKDAAKKKQNNFGLAARETDNPDIVGVYTAMGDEANNFATPIAEVIINQLSGNKIPKEVISEFDSRIRKANPNWVGINHPQAKSQLMGTEGYPKKGAGALRSRFTKLASMAKYRDQGFPSRNRIRDDVVEPELLNADRGASGFTMFDAVPDGKTIPFTENPSYDTGILGQFRGGLIESVPAEIMFPDVFSELSKKLNKNNVPLSRNEILGSLVMDPKLYQKADQKWLDNIAGYLEKNQGKLGASLPAVAVSMLGAGASEDADAGMASSVVNSAKRLIDLGYPESTAMKIASGELPMDQASRMARAKDQGFTDQAYHVGSDAMLDKGAGDYETTGRGILNITPDSTGFFMSGQTPQVSQSYARGMGRAPTSYPLLVNTDNMLKTDAKGMNWGGIWDPQVYGPDGQLVRDVDGYDPADGLYDGQLLTTDRLSGEAAGLGADGIVIDNVQDIGPNPIAMGHSILSTGETPRDYLSRYSKTGGQIIGMNDGSKARSSLAAAFDPAQVGSNNILASNPVATTIAGLLGLGAAAQSNDTYADYSPSNLARLRSDDVGGYQAPQHPRLASAAMGAGQLNQRGVDDALMQFIAPRLPSELMGKIAYNDERGLLDRIKASAGLLGLY